MPGIDIKDLYAPFEAQISRYPLLDSLAVIHAHMQNLQHDQPFPSWVQLPADLAVKNRYERGYFEWELDLLAREMLRRGQPAGLSSLRDWNELSNTVNALKHLTEAISERTGENLERNILIEIGRIAYRQFSWQHRRNSSDLLRYYKIFGHPRVAAIMEAALGISPKGLYVMGLGLAGHFLTRFSLPHPTSFEPLGISRQKQKQFLRQFSAPLSTLVNVTSSSVPMNQDFEYAPNPLRITPLIHVGINGGHHLVAPVPTFLLDCFTSGIYYVLKDDPRFSNAFGSAFQSYIGEVLRKALGRCFSILPEQEYQAPGKNRKDSVDWIVSDGSATLFVECKTKRMTLAARTALVDTAPLMGDVQKVADAVAQTYRTLVDAENGLYPHWKPDGKPIFPIICVLEDWYLFDSKHIQALEDGVRSRLAATEIGASIVDRCPYIIAASADFELLSLVIATAGILPVLSSKHGGERSKWNVGVFLRQEFSAQIRALGNRALFHDEIESIHPALAAADEEER